MLVKYTYKYIPLKSDIENLVPITNDKDQFTKSIQVYFDFVGVVFSFCALPMTLALF